MLRSVTQVIARANALISSGELVAPMIGPILEVRYPGMSTDGGTARNLIPVLVDELREKVTHAESTEKVFLSSSRALGAARDQRDEDKGTVYRNLITVRGAVETGFGRGKGTQLIGLDAGLAVVEAEVLRRYAWVSLEVLEDPEFTPPGGPDEVNIEWLNAAQGIRPAVERFDASLKRVRALGRDEDEARRLRIAAVDDLYACTVRDGHIFEGFYGHAGLDYHAARLRLTTRSRPRDLDPDELPETEAQEAEDAGGSTVPEGTFHDAPPSDDTDTVDEHDASSVEPSPSEDEASEPSV